MKFLYFSDAHIRASTPKSRLDDYPGALWEKFRQITEILLDKNVDAVLINGDLFDTPDPATSIVNKYIELFKYWGLPIYATIGSHDKFGYNDMTITRSGLGTLIAAGLVVLVNDTRIVGDAQLAGVSHSYTLDEDPTNYVRKRIDDNKYMIQMNHGMILDKPFINTHTLISDVQTDANLCLCAHYHPGFGPIQIGDTTWLNIGSLGRTERTARVYQPSVAFIDASSRTYEVIPLETPANNDIFVDKKDGPQTFTNVVDFIERLKQQVDNFECGNLVELINTVGKEGKYSRKIIDMALKYVENS